MQILSHFFTFFILDDSGVKDYGRGFPFPLAMWVSYFEAILQTPQINKKHV